MVAGTSLILPVFNITLCLAGLAGIGGGSLISRLLGQGQEDEARRVSAFSLYLGLAISALFAIVIAVFMEPILGLLGAGDNTYEYARQYALCVIVTGGIPTVLSNVLSNLIRSIGRSKEASAGIILGGLLNIALDPLFMFVLLPDGHEVLGAGLATCLSNCIACLFFVIVLVRMGRGSVITFSPRVGLPCRDSIAAVFGVGVPSAIATLPVRPGLCHHRQADGLLRRPGPGRRRHRAEGGALPAERGHRHLPGHDAPGGLQLLRREPAADGGHHPPGPPAGPGDRGGQHRCSMSSLPCSSSRLFIQTPQTVALASQFLRIRVLATPLMFMSFFTVYLFQAFGKGRISLFLGVTRWLVFNIPMLFLLNHLFGMLGIVWSQATADTLTVLLSLYVYHRYRPTMERPEAHL